VAGRVPAAHAAAMPPPGPDLSAAALIAQRVLAETQHHPPPHSQAMSMIQLPAGPSETDQVLAQVRQEVARATAAAGTGAPPAAPWPPIRLEPEASMPGYPPAYYAAHPSGGPAGPGGAIMALRLDATAAHMESMSHSDAVQKSHIGHLQVDPHAPC